MSNDLHLRDRLTDAVEDTTPPPALAVAALAGGQRRRRRRTVGAVAAIAAAVVAGALVLPDGGPLGVDRAPQIADQASSAMDERGLEWARSLDEGAPPALPFFGAGGALWSQGESYDVPAEVDRSFAPVAVRGGWLVRLLAEDAGQIPLAVLDAAGAVGEPLPTGAREYADPWRVLVSADGTRAAYANIVVDLASRDSTELPNTAGAGARGSLRIVGFTDAGDLLFEGAPYRAGFGTARLLHPDGSLTDVPLPPDTHVPQGSVDVAVNFDYAADNSDTCITTWLLHEAGWEEWKTFCMGKSLGEALSVSPGADWLLTDDLPRVWSLADGEWDRIDIPDGVGPEQMLAQSGGAVWETEDAFLLPVADRWVGWSGNEDVAEQSVQVVRCSVSAGTCERAGQEHRVDLTGPTMWGGKDLKFDAQ